jgi:hypothetical protein
MDAFDFKDPKEPRNTAELIWNVLTVVVLLAAVFVLIYAAITVFDPKAGFQVLSLTTPTSAIPTITPTSRVMMPATWTPGPTDTPTPTETTPPSQTPFPTITPGGPVVTASTADTSYIPQGETQLIADFQNLGCAWTGVGGAVVDLRGSPVTGLFVQMGGTLNGQLFETQTTMTGIAQLYGEAGYEFKIADKPLVSKNTLWVQLVDQANLPLSEKVYFETSDDCKKNLVFISFKQVK